MVISAFLGKSLRIKAGDIGDPILNTQLLAVLELTALPLNIVVRPSASQYA